jgi:AbiV family abortive infection protein
MINIELNQLKVEEIEKIFLKIYENACELLDEAELLYNHQKYARAYSCAHIAFEELGKLPMLYSAAINVYNGKKTDWKYLNKRIRDHKRKISQSYGTVMFLNSVLPKYESHVDNISDEQNGDFNFVEAFKHYVENVLYINPFEFQQYFKELNIKDELSMKYSMTMLLNEYKNGSLYADFDEGDFKKPSEKIDKSTCEYGIILALMQKKFIDAPNFHKEGFTLYKFTDKHEKEHKELTEKYLIFQGKQMEEHSNQK